MKKIKVILTDGDYPNTLAAVRSLGKKGIEVHTCSEKKESLAGKSKYSIENHPVGNPKNERYVEKLKKIIKSQKIDVLLPIGFNAYNAILKKENILKNIVKLPIVDYKTFMLAGNKDKTFKYAKKIGLNVPDTYYKGINDLKKINKYPVVIKATEETGSVKYAKTKKELENVYKEIEKKYTAHINRPIIQEYIPGKNGYGFYGFYWKGKLVDHYIHKRIHMLPETGGPSTKAKTTHISEVYKQGKKILDSLNWHGVAMVEFKQNEENKKYYLMEINPKYWGSLDLAIRAGADFPYYHIMKSMNKKFKIKKRKEITFMWPDREFIRAITGPKKINKILIFIIDLLNPNVKKNIWFEDIKPTIYLLKMAWRKML